MAPPAFTILLPVHRSPELLPFAIGSVLAQSRNDFELFVICDGAPSETADCAFGHAAADDRIKVFVHEKGPRNGELWRDKALATATGDLVCQIADDDLWFPDHLAEMANLLEVCDFGNLTHTTVWPDGRLIPSFYDLADEWIRKRLLTEAFNFFGPTATGYRLSAYRALNEGWSPAPTGLPSDLFMWRKFLRHPGLGFATRHRLTSLCLPALRRRDCSLEQRRQENARFAERLGDGDARCLIRDAIRTEGALDLGRRMKRLDAFDRGGLRSALWVLGQPALNLLRRASGRLRRMTARARERR